MRDIGRRWGGREGGRGGRGIEVQEIHMEEYTIQENE